MLQYKGILAGMRPCGTIVFLGELFGSESMSQVYGNIHTFLNENVQARENLSEFSLCMHLAIVFCSHMHIVTHTGASLDNTVELPNNGHIGSGPFVLYIEVVPL